MSWKSQIQLLDLCAPERIEVICDMCGHVAKIFPGDPLIDRFGHLYLDELERRARCKRAAVRGRQGGCEGKMKVLLCSDSETHSFQAGIV
jgi:hypothetical protein